jgi:hypothetical protein
MAIAREKQIKAGSRQKKLDPDQFDESNVARPLSSPGKTLDRETLEIETRHHDRLEPDCERSEAIFSTTQT